MAHVLSSGAVACFVCVYFASVHVYLDCVVHSIKCIGFASVQVYLGSVFGFGSVVCTSVWILLQAGVRRSPCYSRNSSRAFRVHLNVGQHDRSLQQRQHT